MTAKTLTELKAALRSWHGCELSKQANLVLGSGTKQANIMIIGEAPGKKEDALGTPFMGAAGRLLNELLASIGIERSHVYITNIVKYRPPNNRDPTTLEKQQCAPWLAQEIAIIDPKVIVTLGRHALHFFKPDAIIGQCHGQPMQLNEDCWLYPMYHPAAAMYNGSLRQHLFADVTALQTLMKHCTIPVTK